MIKLKACQRLGMDAFEADIEAGRRYIRSCNVRNYWRIMRGRSANCFNPLTYLRVIGLYDYTLNACPDKKVVHLARNSKKKRVKQKNFNRAMGIVGNILEEESVYCT